MWTAEAVLVCALGLLARGVDSLPPIVLLDVRPPDISRNAEGFVRNGDPRIYLLTDTSPFAQARRAIDRCGALQALRKIASVVVHEAWHVRRPDDEAGAYDAQLTALAELGAGAGNPLYTDVMRARRAALQARRSLESPSADRTGATPRAVDDGRPPDPPGSGSRDPASGSHVAGR